MCALDFKRGLTYSPALGGVDGDVPAQRGKLGFDLSREVVHTKLISV